MSISKLARAVVIDPRKELLKDIHQLARTHRTEQIFGDFVEVSAIVLSNAVDKAQWEVREKRYLEIFKRYTVLEDRQLFPKMFAELVMHMEAGYEDTLGNLFSELELNNKNKGQFFTPYPISSLMSRMIVGDGADLKRIIADKGHVTIQEPACGAGGMLMAFAESCREAGINYQKSVHATAIDIDQMAVHMTYVMLSLRHFPAVVILGDTLRMSFTEHWYTPAHILHGWNARLQQGYLYDEAAWWRDGSIASRVEFLTKNGLALAMARKADPPPEVLSIMATERQAIAAE